MLGSVVLEGVNAVTLLWEKHPSLAPGLDLVPAP